MMNENQIFGESAINILKVSSTLSNDFTVLSSTTGNALYASSSCFSLTLPIEVARPDLDKRCFLITCSGILGLGKIGCFLFATSCFILLEESLLGNNTRLLLLVERKSLRYCLSTKSGEVGNAGNPFSLPSSDSVVAK